MSYSTFVTILITWSLFSTFLMINCSAASANSTKMLEQRSLNMLLQRYGTGENISFDAFKTFLESLGVTNSSIDINGTSSSELEIRSSLQEISCLNASQIFDMYKMNREDVIGKEMLQQMCPLLLQKTVGPTCRKKRLSSNVESEKEDLTKIAEKKYDLANISPKVWIFSTVSISVISLAGLAAVAIIPCLKNVYYNHFIQFLVALAVGSLTGDAMLHLFPHAIVNSVVLETHPPMEHDESATVYKGLVALLGVYFFFNAEKILALITDFRAEKKQIKEDMILHEETGREAAILRRASRMHDLDEDLIAPGLSGKALRSMDNMKRYLEDDHEHALHVSNFRVDLKVTNSSDSPKTNFAHNTNELLHPNYNQHGYSENLTIEPPEVKIILPDSDASEAQVSEAVVKSTSTDHGHSHGHSHGEKVPDSVAGIAWMVIMGDGLHNFSDGLAIGAAFANGLAGGFSTSIAVFCHELPHELGDFAVLLKTGMTVRHALFYNMLSSILCFLGMIIGICLGNIDNASYWIFAVTGGMFIYISLVDMLPELNLVNVKPGESRIVHFLIQNAGIITGVSIMLVIALYEDKIKDMLEPE